MCNDISIILFNHYQNKNFNIKIVHDLCYSQMKIKYFNLPTQTIIKAYREIFASYKSIKSNKQQITLPLIKKNYSMRLDKRLYSNFTQNSIKISSPSSKNKRITLQFKLFEKVKELFNTCTTNDPLLFHKNNKFYLSISFNLQVQKPSNNNELGIDLGVRRLFVTSDGSALKSTEYIKQKRKLNYLKRMLQQKNTNSAKRKLKKIKNKESNFSKNYVHHIVNEILKTDKDVIVIEDLKKIKQKTSKNKEGYKKTNHNRRIGQIPFYLFKQIITYKALHIGKSVVTVNPYNTSKEDCRNGSFGIRKGCRYYCTDGYVFDADWNASLNIAKRYKQHPESFNLPISGRLNFLGRLNGLNNPNVNQPNVNSSFDLQAKVL